MHGRAYRASHLLVPLRARARGPTVSPHRGGHLGSAWYRPTELAVPPGPGAVMNGPVGPAPKRLQRRDLIRRFGRAWLSTPSSSTIRAGRGTSMCEQINERSTPEDL